MSCLPTESRRDPKVVESGCVAEDAQHSDTTNHQDLYFTLRHSYNVGRKETRLFFRHQRHFSVQGENLSLLQPTPIAFFTDQTPQPTFCCD
mmetsp:Transcript_1333/g.4592  ORF Transcript_1333/g.4592 Transcript_1333/m.4592 type:complete len:91 (+) Transcript_1333:2143-2415(+)